MKERPARVTVIGTAPDRSTVRVERDAGDSVRTANLMRECGYTVRIETGTAADYQRAEDEAARQACRGSAATPATRRVRSH